MKITRRQIRRLVEAVYKEEMINEVPGADLTGDEPRRSDAPESPAPATSSSSSSTSRTSPTGLGSWTDNEGYGAEGNALINKVKAMTGENKHMAIAQLLNLYTQGDADTESWNAWVSGWGTMDEIYDFLKAENVTIAELTAAEPHYERLYGRALKSDLDGDLNSTDITSIESQLYGFRNWLEN